MLLNILQGTGQLPATKKHPTQNNQQYQGREILLEMKLQECCLSQSTTHIWGSQGGLLLASLSRCGTQPISTEEPAERWGQRGK